MRSPKLQLAAALVAAGLALSLPAGATAFEETQATVKTSNGFKIFFEGVVGSDRIDIVVNKGPVGGSYTLLQGATATSDTIQGDLGQFGSVDLTFHPKKTEHVHNPHGCHGHLTRKLGVWKGTASFHGENGYTDVSISRANGKYEKDSYHGCPEPHGKVVDLFAQDSSGSTSIDADVVNGGRPGFFADHSYTVGSVSILRTAFRRGKAKEFKFNKSYTHAKAAPSGLFTGTGTFDHDDWTGDLAVKFPGLAPVALTGPGFTATLGKETFKRSRRRSA